MACPAGLRNGIGLDHPWSNAICATRTRFGPGIDGQPLVRNGTGFLFRTADGGSAVGTAAHNLYHIEAGRAIEIDLFFGRVGGAWTARQRSTQYNYPAQYEQPFDVPQWDYGVIRLDALDPGQFPSIPMRVPNWSGDLARLLTGYPDEDDGCRNRFVPHFAVPTVFRVPQTHFGYRNQITYRGMSGGPVLGKLPDSSLIAYGIHILGPASGNPNAPRAIRFSSAIIQDMLGWA